MIYRQPLKRGARRKLDYVAISKSLKEGLTPHKISLMTGQNVSSIWYAAKIIKKEAHGTK